MQFQFINWLLSLLKSQDAEAATSVTLSPLLTTEPLDKPTLSNWDKLVALGKIVNVPESVFIDMFNGKTVTVKGSHAVINMGLHSSKKRLFVFDLVKDEVKVYHVAHGKGSDKSHSGYARVFSNVDGSNCTSLGTYECAESYISGKFGKAMRLDGLDTTNSNARKRAIVFHGSKYCEEAFVRSNGKCGRSLACPAVGFQYSTKLIEQLKNGSLLMIWDGK